jgi:hypothetical protein
VEVRYIVGHGWAERVQNVTALPHRILLIDSAGDVAVVKHWAGEDRGVLLQMSAAELRLLAREHRREMRRRFWARVLGRR